MKIKPGRILIIDDDETSNMITSVVLERNIESVEVIVTTNGQEAIDFLTRVKDDYPQFIFLDINMPLINGFEFLDWFHTNCSQTNSHIIMFSTSNRKDEVNRSLAYSKVVDYIEKPLTKQKITALVKKANKKSKKLSNSQN